MNSKIAVADRRKFLLAGSVLVVSAAGVAATRRAAAAPAGTRLDEKDPQARGLGYHHDSAKVDKTAFPKHVASQVCGNCQFYQGKAGDAWGPCPVFANKLVNAKGWCGTWMKKA